MDVEQLYLTIVGGGVRGFLYRLMKVGVERKGEQQGQGRGR